MLIVVAVILLLLTGSYFALQNSGVQTYITQQVANFLSKQINSKISVGNVSIGFFNKIVLDDVLIEDQNTDTIFYSKHLTASIDSFNIRKKKLSVDQIFVEQNELFIQRDSNGVFNFNHIVNYFRNKKDSITINRKWQISCNNFGFDHSSVSYKDYGNSTEKSIFINDIKFDVSQVRLLPDSTLFKINDLVLNKDENLYLEHLGADVIIQKDTIDFKDFQLKTKNSNLNSPDFSLIFNSKKKRLFTDLNFNVNLSASNISLIELGEFIPSIAGMDQEIQISGQIYGNLSDLNGKNIALNTGKNTAAFLDFYVNDFTDIENMFLFVDLKSSSTSFSDLSEIQLPSSFSLPHFTFPDFLSDAGKITYKGNFTGFLSDFVAFGTFNSQMGVLKTDVSVIPSSDGITKYKGKVTTEDFMLGELLKQDEIGNITFNGNVDGDYDKINHSISGTFDGDIARVEINQYNYENIKLDGTLDNKMFDGLINIDDPNLKFDFSGRIDLNPEIPVFDFRLSLEKALPGKLNLSENFPASELAFQMNANFEGNKLDNLRGSIKLEDGLYKNRHGELALNGMELKSNPTNPDTSLTFTSDFFDVKIIGKYHFQSILNAFEKSFNYYLPAIDYEKFAEASENVFDYQIEVKKLDELTAVFMPKYQVETPFFLYGSLDSENSVFKLEGSIPGIKSNKVSIKNIFIGNRPLGDEYSSKFRFDEVNLANGISFYDLTVDSKIAENTIDNQITWTNYRNITTSGSLKTRAVFSEKDSTQKPNIFITGFPTTIFIKDSTWQISTFTASIDTTAIEINNFSFSKKEQEITIDGKISENKADILSAKFENLDLNSLNSYLNQNLNIKGKIDGSAGVFDFYGQRMIISDVGIKNFEFKDKTIGDIAITSYWDNFATALNSELTINKNNQYSLKAEGSFTPSTNAIDFDVEVDSLSLVILETVIRNNLSDIRGDATGKVKIHGTPDNILIDGALLGANAGLKIDYTQVDYTFNDTVYFKGDTIQFDQITIHDKYNNNGIFNGFIVQQDNFQNLEYNLTLSSPKILALNTTAFDNEKFYGLVMANARIYISGEGDVVNLSGTGITLPETNVNISLDSENEIEQYDFIQFVSADDSKKEESLFLDDGGDFTMNLTIQVTPEAKAQLIYNSQIGDVIKGQGNGLLYFGMDKNGNITLSGDYTVEKGDYLFTLENIINKRFTIEQGGTIIWTGDPYNANIDLSAVYNLRASLYELVTYFAGQNQGGQIENLNQRIPVECKILLSDELSNPAIKFEIDFPTAGDRTVDLLQQFFNTEEEISNQMFSLLALGKFYIPEYMRGIYEAQNPNVIGTTASELISNQLSNWLSKISDAVDFGVNYRPGNQLTTNDELELAMTTQIFNDRVTINGNIGNNTNPNSTNNSELVGDFDINVKLIPSGNIQFKAYNRSNNNLIYETAPYTQGIGLTFKEEYNSFKEFLKKLTTLFQKKENK